MKITVSNKLYIEGASDKVIRELKKALEIPNPTFQVMVRKFGARAYHMKALKQKFCYYEYKDGVFQCGRGSLMRIHRYLRNHGIKHELTRDLVYINLKKPLKFNGTLRGYQEGVTDEIIGSGSYGIIKLGTGFGKTLIACELIRKLNKTALIIVPRVSLLNQFKETLKEFYDYECGIIQGKTWDIKDITVASFQTLKKNKCDSIRKRFSCLFMDEAHTAISNKGITTIHRFNPTYLYGLTATPKRSDNQGDAIGYTFGPILIDKKLPQEKPTVQVVESNVEISGVDYMDMVENMVENEERNELISSIAYAELLDKRKILILTKRIEHYETIEKEIYKFRGVPKIFSISSKTKQSERDILLTKLRNNEEDFDIILGTVSLLGTGTDIPKLDCLIIACDIKFDGLVLQTIGRILRVLEGKKRPKVIDIHDNLHGLFHRQYLERRKLYRKMEWDVIDNKT